MKEEQERTPLRTILQNFLNHIENLEIQRIEDSYEKEFQELKFFSELLKTSKQYSCSEGEKEVNRKKNRYKDILPFDNSRVILSEYAGVPGSDYINANYIRGASGSPAYIACQGPLPHTVNDFWRMVVECEVQVIVMACNEEEAGKHKCENYWVEREGEEKQFGMVSIQLIKASTVCPDFLVRTMRLKYINSNSEPEERTVCQFHYSAWPDHGVPPLVRPLLDMVRLVRDTQASETLPVLVHCSAGCGRTGTICAIDYVWGLLRAGKLNTDFSLYKLVRDMRKQRIAMVQTKEQYVLVHQAVRELFQEQLRMIDSHPYENIDANGMPLVKHLEPLYTTPGPATPELSCEEKQDGKEKEIETAVPPLPQKKRSHTAASKHEKEVENLTEKQRSIVEQAGNSLLQKPRIAKLKALFERSPAVKDRSSQTKHRNSQLVSRSHSLGAVRSGEAAQALPIPCPGILRVPHLSSGSKPTLPVKRSKSLKVLGSSQSYKLSLASQDKSSSTSSTISSTELDTDTAISAEAERYVQASREDVTQVPKPLIPPKMKIMDADLKKLKSRAVLSSNPNVNTIVSHQAEQFINCEHSHAASVIPKRRRSLESINLEETTANVMTAYSQNDGRISHRKPHVLDEDARRLLQDCKDYLKGTLKTDKLQGRERTTKVQHNEQFQNLALEAQRKVNAIVAGLGVRERRNSFRQAVGTSQEGDSKSSNRSKDHDKMWPVGNFISKFSPFQHSPFQTASGTVPSFEQNKGNTRSRVQQITLQPKLARTSKSHTVHTKANENSSSTSMVTNNIVPELSTSGANLVPSREANKKTDSVYARMGKVGAYPKQLSRETLRTDVQNSEVHSHIRQLNETARHGKASYPNANVAPQYVPTLGAGCAEVINSSSGSSCSENRICAPQESGSVTKEPKLRTTTGVASNDKGRSNGSLPLHVMSSPPSPTAAGSTPITDPQAAFKQQQVQQKLQGGQEVSYGLVAGVQLRRGSRDDLALCPSPNNSSSSGPNAPRVRRHASVVLLRRSIVEGSSNAQPSLAVWKSPSSESSDQHGPYSSVATKPEVKDVNDKWWSEAPGIDVDTVGASMGDSSCNITRALENLHLRKPSIPTGAAAASSSSLAQGFASRQPPLTQHSTAATVKKQHYF